MLRKQYSAEFAPSAPREDWGGGKQLSSLSLDCDVPPSAPPPDSPSFTNPVTRIELTLSASNLLNLDQVTKSDPLCVVFLHDSTTAEEWIELGRTESIMNTLNPEWTTKFLVDYRFEERQLLTFMVFDKDCAKYSLDNHDFLGTLECSLGEIVCGPHSKLTRSLKLPAIHSTGNKESTISIVAEEAGDCKKFINFRLAYSTKKLLDMREKASSMFKNDKRKVFVNISKQLLDGSWILLYRTERILPTKTEVSGETRINRNLDLELVHSCPSVTCTDFNKLIISEFEIKQQKTFMDYLQDGLEIKFAVAIDFTASNGEPTSHSSLHYKHGKRDNPYVMTLKIVGEILEDYSKSKQFYAYGFGAKGFPLNNRVNHKFALNFKTTNPQCKGIDGVLDSYYRTLQRVRLFGPTCFAPIIREVTEIAKSSSSTEYYVLLILTDGIVCDPETTRDALVEASETSVSVIIIGIGDEHFTIMEKFDSDEKLLKSRSKKRASRDIVQFVELRKFVNFKSVVPITEGAKKGLARSVLAELPQQVVSWMNLCKATRMNIDNNE